ncbi:actin, alpha skeletal muscle-like [Capsicum chacoense]
MFETFNVRKMLQTRLFSLFANGRTTDKEKKEYQHILIISRGFSLRVVLHNCRGIVGHVFHMAEMIAYVVLDFEQDSEGK